MSRSGTRPNAEPFYTDVSGTNGAWRWISTGTTNTSWRVISGDTGLRVLTPISGTVTSGTLSIQRVNGASYLWFTDVKLATSGNVIVLSTPQIPAGMWPPTYSTVWVSAGAAMRRVMWGHRADSRVIVYSAAAGDIINAVVSVPAEAGWPATLPGTAG